MQRIDDYVAECLAKNKDIKVTGKTTQITQSLQALEKEFLRGIPSLSCQSCKGISPKFRKETQIKIFQKHLSSTQRRLMKAKGLTFEVLNISRKKSEEHDNEDEMMDDQSDVEDHNVIDEDKMRYITPIEVKEHLTRFWAKERPMLDLLYGTSSSPKTPRTSSPDMFFINILAVPPNKFRPLSKMNDVIFEHPQNIYLTDILKANQAIAEMHREQQIEGTNDTLRKMVNYCVLLQNNVNNFLDSSAAPPVNGKIAPPGIRQLLEKKEGLFRKHM